MGNENEQKRKLPTKEDDNTRKAKIVSQLIFDVTQIP
jgi:hypothetical protein